MSYNLESEEQERKLFVGGLNKIKTDEEDLKQFFQMYGSIIDCTIMRDADKQSRGFGFVLFENSSSVDKIIAAKKEGNSFLLDEHHIEVKRALPKVPGGNAGSSRTGGLYRKIFVGGLPSTITEEELRKYFERYGRVNEIELLRDRDSNRLRGFAFVTFDDEDSADKCIQKRSHEICKKICEVKRAQTRSTLTKFEQDDRGGRMGGGGGRDSGYHGGSSHGGSHHRGIDGDSRHTSSNSGKYPSCSIFTSVHEVNHFCWKKSFCGLQNTVCEIIFFLSANGKSLYILCEIIWAYLKTYMFLGLF